jgi:hypothetical protein
MKYFRQLCLSFVLSAGLSVVLGIAAAIVVAAFTNGC